RRLVFVVDGEGTVVARAVDLGPLVGELRVIRSGLTAKDQVIISGVQRARPGQRVQPQKGAVRQAAGSTGPPAPPPRTRRASSAEVVAPAQTYTMNLSRFFVDRPIFAAVIAIVITLIGAFSFPLLPLSQYPEIAPPTIVIQA